MRTFKTADVRLAAAIEKTDALDMWRKRFATLVIVRAERIVTRALMLVRTDWEVELADADGWSVTLDTLWVFDAIDVEELRGELVVRGQPRRFAATVRATKQWDVVVAAATWEGKLTDLGIKPFKALLGARKLENWIRLRREARFSSEAPL